jgi:hypothetical protein
MMKDAALKSIFLNRKPQRSQRITVQIVPITLSINSPAHVCASVCRSCFEKSHASKAQLLSYMKLLNKSLGLLSNFHEIVLKKASNGLFSEIDTHKP